MPQFKISPARGRDYTVEASSLDAVTAFIKRDERRNLFGVEGDGKSRFYLDRGHGPLWQIGARAAANELAVGGFKTKARATPPIAGEE